MDTSASTAQDAQNKQQAAQSDDPISQTAQGPVDDGQQSTIKQPVKAPSKTQISISGGGGLEAGSGMIAEDPDDDEDDEDELQVAPQEKKNLGVMGQGDSEEQDDEQPIVSQATVVDTAEENAEIQPAVPELVTSSPEVEKLIEITPAEKPKITKELEDFGVTHSGLGFIDAAQAHLPTPKIPVTYAEAMNAEKQINNKLHSSKFWLFEKVKYLWRKVNPDIASSTKKQPATDTVPVKSLPVQTQQSTSVKTSVTEKVAA